MVKRKRVWVNLGLYAWLTLTSNYLVKGEAHAHDLSCLPTHVVTAAQAHYQVGAVASSGPLISSRADGHFVTGAFVDYALSPAGELQIEIRYPGAKDEVGLPYQIFAIELKLAGETAYFLDLSQGCGSPGIAVYPGQKILLPPAKLGNDSPLGACTKECSALLRVWGQL